MKTFLKLSFVTMCVATLFAGCNFGREVHFSGENVTYDSGTKLEKGN